jgi:hypothetical protein
VEGRDFNIALQKVDRNGDGFIDWQEFLWTLVANYLAVFHGTESQTPWIIRLNAYDLKEVDAPASIQIFFAIASAQCIGTGGERRNIGKGRTFFIAADEAVAQAFIREQFPNRKDVGSATDVTHAEEKLRQLFNETFARERLVEGTLKIEIRRKGEKTKADVEPKPPSPNIYDANYREWLRQHYPDEYDKLMSKYGHLIKQHQH